MAEKASFIQKINDFIKTPTGKIVLIASVIGVILFFCIFVFLIYSVYNQMTSKEEKPLEIEVSGKTTPGEKAEIPTEKKDETVEELEEEKPIDIKTFEVFEYRNPFKPTVQIEFEPDTGTGTATSTASGTSTATGVTQTTGGAVPLSLEDIYTESGTNYANVVYGGKSYKVTTGDRIADSPYQVQSIGSGSITLLYGDDSIVLKLGETILK